MAKTKTPKKKKTKKTNKASSSSSSPLPTKTKNTMQIDPSNLSNLLLLFSTTNDDENKNNNNNDAARSSSSTTSILNNNNNNVDIDNDNNFEPYISPNIQIATTTSTSSSSSSVNITHGRGLIATKDIVAGECLFVIPPTYNVSIDDVIELYNNTNNNNNEKTTKSDDVESIAESLLLKSIKESPSKHIKSTIIRILLGNKKDEGTDDDEEDYYYSCPTFEDLLIGTSTSNIDDENCNKEDANDDDDVDVDDDGLLLSIIRRNAFGPDFITYNKIEQILNEEEEKAEKTKTQHKHKQQQIYRILSLYPLAAMLNHSCIPNVVRVYKSKWLIAHASEPIKSGSELVWSYIPPTTPYPQRKQQLQDQSSFNFNCLCCRCQIEESIWNNNDDPTSELLEKAAASTTATTSGSTSTVVVVDDLVQQLENTILSFNNKSIITNEAKRYVRLGFCQTLYIPYLNNQMMMISDDATTSSSSKAYLAKYEELLQLGTQLHFTFVSCNNACTEHLSILYFCYDLISKIHSTTPGGCIQKVRFWTEQIKKACMIRYGNLGNDLESVRSIMQHSKIVLRNVNGMQQSKYHDFI